MSEIQKKKEALFNIHLRMNLESCEKRGEVSKELKEELKRTRKELTRLKYEELQTKKGRGK